MRLVRGSNENFSYKDPFNTLKSTKNLEKRSTFDKSCNLKSCLFPMRQPTIEINTVYTRLAASASTVLS